LRDNITNGDYQDKTQYLDLGLIFLSIRVPKKNGLEIVKIIKKDPRLKKVPTIMLTTSYSSSDVLHDYKNRANSYLKNRKDLRNWDSLKKLLTRF
jgi:CheY-like chemotaxis protein